MAPSARARQPYTAESSWPPSDPEPALSTFCNGAPNASASSRRRLRLRLPRCFACAKAPRCLPDNDVDSEPHSLAAYAPKYHVARDGKLVRPSAATGSTDAIPSCVHSMSLDVTLQQHPLSGHGTLKSAVSGGSAPRTSSTSPPTSPTNALGRSVRRSYVLAHMDSGGASSSRYLSNALCDLPDAAPDSSSPADLQTVDLSPTVHASAGGPDFHAHADRSSFGDCEGQSRGGQCGPRAAAPEGLGLQHSVFALSPPAPFAEVADARPPPRLMPLQRHPVASAGLIAGDISSLSSRFAGVPGLSAPRPGSPASRRAISIDSPRASASIHSAKRPCTSVPHSAHYILKPLTPVQPPPQPPAGPGARRLHVLFRSHQNTYNSCSVPSLVPAAAQQQPWLGLQTLSAQPPPLQTVPEPGAPSASNSQHSFLRTGSVMSDAVPLSQLLGPGFMGLHGSRDGAGRWSRRCTGTGLVHEAPAKRASASGFIARIEHSGDGSARRTALSSHLVKFNITDHYTLGVLLNSGLSAEVYLGTNIATQHEVAIKVYFRNDRREIHEACTEHICMTWAQSPNVLRCFGLFFLNERPCLVLELASMSLRDLILEFRRKKELLASRKGSASNTACAARTAGHPDEQSSFSSFSSFSSYSAPAAALPHSAASPTHECSAIPPAPHGARALQQVSDSLHSCDAADSLSAASRRADSAPPLPELPEASRSSLDNVLAPFPAARSPYPPPAAERSSGAAEFARQRRQSFLAPSAFPQTQLVQIVSSLLEGIAAVHSAGLAHCDLKPENVMIMEDGTIKLCDFGAACAIDPATGRLAALPDVVNDLEQGMIELAQAEEYQLGGQVKPFSKRLITQGTDTYGAPERGNDADLRKADVWAIGCITYELCSGGGAVFTWSNEREKYAQIMAAQLPDWKPRPLPAHSAQWQSLVDAMLSVDVAKRPLPFELLSFDIFRQMYLHPKRHTTAHSVRRRCSLKDDLIHRSNTEMCAITREPRPTL